MKKIHTHRRVSALLKLAKRFSKGKEQFARFGKAQALFTAVEGRERWGIWRLFPVGLEHVKSWAEFDLLAASAIDLIGLPPLPSPTALEYDPNWCRRDPPQGLDTVCQATRAWLDFLRTELLKRDSNGADSLFDDIWGISAVQCTLTARDIKSAGYASADYAAVHRSAPTSLHEDAAALPKTKLVEFANSPQQATGAHIFDSSDEKADNGVAERVTNDVLPQEPLQEERSANETGEQSGRLSSSTSDEQTPESNVSRRVKLHKGDGSLLAGRSSVSFRTAEKYLGITERQRQKLIKQGRLAVEGMGQNRQVTTISLQNYLPLKENPN